MREFDLTLDLLEDAKNPLTRIIKAVKNKLVSAFIEFSYLSVGNDVVIAYQL